MEQTRACVLRGKAQRRRLRRSTRASPTLVTGCRQGSRLRSSLAGGSIVLRPHRPRPFPGPPRAEVGRACRTCGLCAQQALPARSVFPNFPSKIPRAGLQRQKVATQAPHLNNAYDAALLVGATKNYLRAEPTLCSGSPTSQESCFRISQDSTAFTDIPEQHFGLYDLFCWLRAKKTRSRTAAV